MNRYLVVSYDPDQQQWFYDVVFADTPEAATEKLLSVRQYCTDADALSTACMEGLSEMLAETSPEQSEVDLADIRAEIADGEQA